MEMSSGRGTKAVGGRLAAESRQSVDAANPVAAEREQLATSWKSQHNTRTKNNHTHLQSPFRRYHSKKGFKITQTKFNKWLNVTNAKWRDKERVQGVMKRRRKPNRE